MAKETQLTRRILLWLNQQPGVKAQKIHGSAYSQAGCPDLLVVALGRVLMLEVKTATGRVSKIQEHRMAQWRAAGAVAEVVRSLDDVKRLFGA